MKDQWWTFGQAAHFVLANYPCDGPVEANRLLADKVADGSLRTRYQGGLPISREEWVRRGDIDLEIEGAGIPHGSVEYLRASIEKLCRQVAQSGVGGRPLKDWESFLIEVIFIANRDPDGLPIKQADLEQKMLSWAEANMADPPKETAVRDMVGKIYQRLKR